MLLRCFFVFFLFLELSETNKLFINIRESLFFEFELFEIIELLLEASLESNKLVSFF